MEEMIAINIVMIPASELQALKEELKNIRQEVLSLKERRVDKSPEPAYIPAITFMKAVNVRRTKFYELISANKIQTLKKGRRIYVLASEVARYFADSSIK